MHLDKCLLINELLLLCYQYDFKTFMFPPLFMLFMQSLSLSYTARKVLADFAVFDG